MHRLLLASLLSATALACSNKPEVKPEPAPAPPPTASAGSLAEKPAPLPSEAPVERPPIQVTERPEKLTLSGTPFDPDLVAEIAWVKDSDRTLVLHPLRNDLLVSYGGFVKRLTNNRLEAVKNIAPPWAFDAVAIVGDWPDAVIAHVEYDLKDTPGAQRSAPGKKTAHVRFKGDGWSEQSDAAGTKAAAWRNGSILSLRGQALSIPVGSGVTPPRQSPPRDPARCKESPAELVPEALDALPAGEAFLLGKRCGGGAYAVERWPAGEGDSIIDDLPGAPADAKRAFFSAGSRDRAHAVLSTGAEVYAARWDGQSFRKLALQAEGDVRAIWTAADGTLFAVLQQRSTTPRNAKGELLRITLDGQLSRSPTFTVNPLTRVWAADAQTAHVGSHPYILSTRPGLVFSDADLPPPEAPPPPPSGLPPHTEGCPTPFVFLYDVSSVSPPGYAFPSTRKALSTFARVADISLVEFVHTSRRRLGVRVPSVEVGNEVMAHIVANMKDEHPELVCLDPQDSVRVIPLR
ncbi:MAG TPA: hypothetical protein VLS89_03780 [Candidatus Nanopelagicales bacterium]|nr:hypothetical protein [Candidatus Nanopelagicales bacterium]